MALPQLLSAESGLADQPLTVEQGSWLVALMAVASCAFVPVFAGLGGHVGRKMLGYLTVTPALVSWTILMFSTSVVALYVARVLVGVQSAGTMVMATLYVSETTTDKVRGALGSLLPLFCNCGSLCAFVVGAYLPYDVVLYLNLAPVLTFVFCFAFMPETPHRLMHVRRHHQARKALRWLRRGISERQVDREVERIQASLGRDTAEAGYGGGVGRAASLAELLRCRASLLGFAIVLVAGANVQLCGSFAVLNYAVLIFDEAGGSVSPEVATIVLGALQVVGGLLSTVFIERIGRRPLLFLANGAVGTSVALLGVYLYLKQQTQVDVTSVGWLPVTCLSIYVLMHAVGLSPLAYVVVSETVAPRIRGLAAIITYSTSSGTAAVMSKLYPAMSQSMGAYGTFWFFAAVCLACALIGWCLLPETKGRPLEDILKELNGGKDVHVSSSQ
ncbi:facilitated trehalose transporter Tret1-like [Schistocerca americana]|uniref:facilitated trehalose transporter Tret1-like n=1 Tax=Schistocerca americana TaxID=7009 RepID=UPI001F4F7C02|nr:facilitated trehalose transporter Tret1-like [Schistocerca americana]